MKSQNTKFRMKLKRDDSVIVVRGKRVDRGKTGKILRIISDKKRVVVEKIHIVKEYVRANPQKNIQGGIVDREGSIPLGSVMYYCKECEQGVRIGYKISKPTADSGAKTKSSKETKSTSVSRKPKTIKQRICKKCGVVLD